MVLLWRGETSSERMQLIDPVFQLHSMVRLRIQRTRSGDPGHMS